MMRSMLNVMAALALCLAANAAFAASANEYEATTKFTSKIYSTTPPQCPAGDVLTYNGTNYACLPLVKPASCPAGQVVQSIAADGTLTCVAEYPVVSCAPPGNPYHAATGATDLMAAYDPALPLSPTNPKCIAQSTGSVALPTCTGNTDSLTTTDGVHFVCNNSTEAVVVGWGRLMPYNSHCDWNHITARNLNTTSGHPDDIDALSADCSNACDKFCINRSSTYIGGFLAAVGYAHEGITGAGGTGTCVCIK